MSAPKKTIELWDYVDRAGQQWTVFVEEIKADGLPIIWAARFVCEADEDAETAETFTMTFASLDAARGAVRAWARAKKAHTFDYSADRGAWDVDGVRDAFDVTQDLDEIAEAARERFGNDAEDVAAEVALLRGLDPAEASEKAHVARMAWRMAEIMEEA